MTTFEKILFFWVLLFATPKLIFIPMFRAMYKAMAYTDAQEEADKEASDARRSQVRTVDRSERVRTYNFAENRIADHRVNFKAYNLDQVLDGDLDAVVQALLDADTEARLATAGQ